MNHPERIRITGNVRAFLVGDGSLGAPTAMPVGTILDVTAVDRADSAVGFFNDEWHCTSGQTHYLLYDLHEDRLDYDVDGEPITWKGNIEVLS